VKITAQALALRYYQEYREGKTIAEISERTGYTKQYISQIIKKYVPEFTARSRSETKELRELAPEPMSAEDLERMRELQDLLHPEEIDILLNKKD
jgi:predicted transcriptional regulator